MNKYDYYPDHLHSDDLGEVVGTFYTNGSVDGLPVREWFVPKEAVVAASLSLTDRRELSRKRLDKSCIHSSCLTPETCSICKGLI